MSVAGDVLASIEEGGVVQRLALGDPRRVIERALAVQMPPPRPFAPDRAAALGELSRIILKDPHLRADSAMVALAYWLRPASLTQLMERHGRPHLDREGAVLVPAGLVFHIAPANVDTLFAYSWALSWLCGNTNIVRLPTERPPVLAALLAALERFGEAHPELAEDNSFITYPHDTAISTALSAHASQRIVWGGDETVARIRSIPLPPHASERSFASKYSYSLIDAHSFLDLDEDGRDSVTTTFHRDIAAFGQMACSSPHVIYWLTGDSDAAALSQARERFDDALERAAALQSHPDASAAISQAVHRINYAFEQAATASAPIQPAIYRRGFTPLTLSDPAQRPHCGAGLIGHATIETLADLAPLCQPGDQTLTHFGLTPAELQYLAQILGPRGLDRIIPIGQALDFSSLWDSYDLVADLTRKVAVG